MRTNLAMKMGELNAGKELMVFDWHKAAKLIRENKPTVVFAGLKSDWEYTGGAIYASGKPIPKDDTYVFLASTWAKPEIEIDNEKQCCYVMQSQTDGWDAHTYWPQSALDILEGKEP